MSIRHIIPNKADKSDFVRHINELVAIIIVNKKIYHKN